MSKNLNEASYPRKPITALRRCEAELTLLRSQMCNLGQLVTDFAKSVSEVRCDLDALSDRINRELGTLRPR
jgi:predicted  nucleic acid-binding Zn-ribbon protein